METKQHKLEKVFFYTASILGILILLLSFGWYLLIFGIIIFPVFIFHIIAGHMSFKSLPNTRPLLATTSILFLVFALLRFDGDDVGIYSGWSVVSNLLGLAESSYVKNWPVNDYHVILMLLILITLDIFLIRKTIMLQKQSK